MPEISVVIPLYNKDETIERAIRSILNQTVQDFEIVVVNDGSTDDGPGVVDSIKDERIRLIHQDNQGVSAARNRGIAEAQFDLVAFLDADDEWKPQFLETITRLVHHFPEAAVFATGYLFCQGDHTKMPKFRGIPADGWEGVLTDYFRISASSNPPICSSSVAVRKEAIDAVGGFPVGVTAGEDLLTWARLAVKYQIAFSSQTLSLFHLGGNFRPSCLRRQPENNDIVGAELQQLLKASVGRQNQSLRLYVSLWHKMRASILLRTDRRTGALNHALLAARMNPFNWKNYALVLFALCPPQGSKRLFGLMLNLRQKFKNCL